MEVAPNCSECGGLAVLLCICSRTRLCKACTTSHVADSKRVHTFLPVACESSINAGDDHYSVVRRSQLAKGYKEYLRQEIDSIEVFKQASLTSLESTSNELTSRLDASITQAIEKLAREVEIAKRDAFSFATEVGNEHIDISKEATSIFLKNAVNHNIDFKTFPIFKSAFEQVEYEEDVQKFANFELKCPTETLFELTRTPTEYQDWLLVLKTRKEEELKKQERKMSRLVGGAGSWGVGGPPTLDAFAFKVNVDIWLTGIGTGNGNSTGTGCSIQDIEIRKTISTRGELLYRHPETVTATWDGTEDQKFFKVQFKTPVRLLKDTEYCVRVGYMAGGSIFSANGTVTTSFEGIAFTFLNASFDGGDNSNSSSPTSGPTRDLYFALAEVSL